MKEYNQCEVIVIGGSYAGLSAAMALGRSLRNTLIIDSGSPSNRFAPHAHNMITHDGSAPDQIASIAKVQVLAYPNVRFENTIATGIRRIEYGFEVLTKVKTYECRKVIFATGIKDIFLDIEGFEECWGKTIIHCPFCHGYENRGKKTALIANKEKTLHLIPMLRHLTNQLSLIPTHDDVYDKDTLEKFLRSNMHIVHQKISSFQHTDGNLSTIVFEDGSREQFDVAYAALPFIQLNHLPVEIGCELTEFGQIQVDEFHQTSVSGIYACGDNSSMMRSIANAIATGNKAGAMVHASLLHEDF